MFLGAFFNVTKGSPFQSLGYLELIQNRLKPKGPPLNFSRYCETLFFSNLTEQLYSQYFTHCLSIFQLSASFSETLI